MAVSIEQVLQKARRLAKKGQNDQAAEQYKSILEAFPNNQRAIEGLKSLGNASNNLSPRGIPQGGYPQGGIPKGGYRQAGSSQAGYRPSGNPQRNLAAQKPSIPDRAQIEQMIGLYNNGQFEQALNLAQKLAKSFPNALMVFNIMGAINAAMGNYEPAVAAYSRARDLDPRIAEIHNNLGLALDASGRNQEAVDSFNEAIKLKRDFASAYNNLGLATYNLGKPKEAIDCYLKAIKIEPKFAEAYNNIGLAQNRLHLHDKAVISYDKALEINADIAKIHKNKGVALILMGKHAEAKDCLTQALNLNSGVPDTELLYHFSELPAHLVSSDLLTKLDQYQAELKNNDPLENVGLNLIKATLLHIEGNHEQAWKILVTANQSFIDHMDIDIESDMKNNQKYLQLLRNQTTNDDKDENLIIDIPISLFVLGPSRSGKSTLEHLIASSAKVKQGYESSVLSNAVFFAARDAGLGEIDYLDELPVKENENFKMHYLDLIKNFADRDQIFTATAPGTIRNINRAAETLPNVRMVFVKRNIDDNILRIFMKQYQSVNPYAYNIENIREYITWYNELIDFFHNKFPQSSIIIHYEDMIEEPAKVLKEVSDLCGMDLSDGEFTIPGDDRGCAKPYAKWMS